MGSPRSYRPIPQYVRGLPIHTADYPIMTLTLCTNLAMTYCHLQGPWHSTYLTASWVALALPGPCPGRWEACSSTRQTAHFMPLTSCATFTLTLMKWQSNLPIPPCAMSRPHAHWTMPQYVRGSLIRTGETLPFGDILAQYGGYLSCTFIWVLFFIGPQRGTAGVSVWVLILGLPSVPVLWVWTHLDTERRGGG